MGEPLPSGVYETGPPDIYVISDMHIGRGKNPATGRYYSLEAFFYDDDLLNFCERICQETEADGRTLVLVLNGDAFDFLRIDAESGEDAMWPHHGPVATPAVARRLAQEILAGHPHFSDALALVLSRGHRVVLLPGNHDHVVQWSGVQEELKAAVTTFLERREAAGAIERLEVRQWFYHEPGRIWIEHGCQYDPENSFRWLLRRPLETAPDELHEAERDLPLGNFFQRYLYNAFGSITFIVPSSRANLRYFRWLMINQPRFLIGVIFSHLPFLYQVIRRFALAAERGPHEAMRNAHDAELEQLAEESGLGDRLHDVDALKETRADVVQATRGIFRQLTKLIGAGLAIALLVTALWFVAFLSINQIRAGFGLKTLMFLSLNLMLLASAVGVLIYSLMRAGKAEELPLRRAARQIAALLDVPIVCFGHIHDEVVWPIGWTEDGERRWYFNTGTWIAVFTHDVLLPRERVQYTFLRVRDNDAELLYWSAGRNQSRPVILLEETQHLPLGLSLPGLPEGGTAGGSD